MLEQLAPGENLDGKCAESRRDGAGVERDTDVVIDHLDTICIESAVKGWRSQSSGKRRLTRYNDKPFP